MVLVKNLDEASDEGISEKTAIKPFGSNTRKEVKKLWRSIALPEAYHGRLDRAAYENNSPISNVSSPKGDVSSRRTESSSLTYRYRKSISRKPVYDERSHSDNRVVVPPEYRKVKNLHEYASKGQYKGNDGLPYMQIKDIKGEFLEDLNTRDYPFDSFNEEHTNGNALALPTKYGEGYTSLDDGSTGGSFTTIELNGINPRKSKKNKELTVLPKGSFDNDSLGNTTKFKKRLETQLRKLGTTLVTYFKTARDKIKHAFQRLCNRNKHS
ncbi:hypothetical protein BgAZ_207120 [Babesia gibsoni]|uniref:Uncharacterized protein n=1 Tax=Babesia gibsoni TaxID=33632 RepID=A0AAD8PEF9_BABGI|nr:hypothetical protein BgAZ_207120 [Babesia gibsoni]